MGEHEWTPTELLLQTLGVQTCSDVLYQHRDPTKRYDVIDLDPYGTASPFIDGAVQAVSDGGIVDMALWAFFMTKSDKRLTLLGIASHTRLALRYMH